MRLAGGRAGGEGLLKVDPLPGLPLGIFVVGDAVAGVGVIVGDDPFMPLLTLLGPEPPEKVWRTVSV